MHQPPHTYCTPAQPHTLLTSSPCGLVKRQFAACSKAGLGVAAASQVTNWQGCFPLPLIVGVGVFTAAAESPRRRPGPALEREQEGNDGNTIHVFCLYFFACVSCSYFFPASQSVSVCLFLFILSLRLRATSHIINLLHSPSPSLLICAVIVLPLLCFFFKLTLSPYLISKFQQSFNSVF